MSASRLKEVTLREVARWVKRDRIKNLTIKRWHRAFSLSEKQAGNDHYSGSSASLIWKFWMKLAKIHRFKKTDKSWLRAEKLWSRFSNFPVKEKNMVSLKLMMTPSAQSWCLETHKLPVSQSISPLRRLDQRDCKTCFKSYKTLRFKKTGSDWINYSLVLKRKRVKKKVWSMLVNSMSLSFHKMNPS